jgi:hypothetical protein
MIIKMKYFIFFLSISLNIFVSKAQITDQKIVDSIFRDLQLIRKSIDNSEYLNKQIAILTKLKSDDSIAIANKNIQIGVLSSQIAVLEQEKKGLVSSKTDAELNLKKLNIDQASYAEKQIEIFLNQDFDETGRLLLNKNLISSILTSAQKSSPKNLNMLIAFLEIKDSIEVIRKIFDEPYSKLETQKANEKIEKLKLLAKQKLQNNNTSIMNELTYLQNDVNDYCKQTSELYSAFTRIYPLSKTNIQGDGDRSVFIRRVDEQYFIAYRYNHLIKLMDKYIEEQSYREQFKDKPTFTCN